MTSYSQLYTIRTRAEFEAWLGQMNNELAKLPAQFPPHVAQSLDYSLESLLVLEKWLLGSYRSIDDIRCDWSVLDQTGRYVGETLRQAIGGRWTIELDERNVYFGYPMIEVAGMVSHCPVTDVTAALDRRQGDFIHSCVSKFIARYKGCGDKIVPPDEMTEDHASYQATAFVEDATSFSIERAKHVLAQCDGVTSAKLLNEKTLLLRFGEFRLRITLEDEPFVREEIEDEFKYVDKSDPLALRAAACSRRLSVWSDSYDPNMDHFNDYVIVLGRLEKSFEGLIFQDPNTGEWI